MAGKDINIPITGDARDFIRETENVEDALDDVSDALDDMTRDTKKGGRDAERAVDDLADSFKDAVKRAKDLEDAGDDAGKGVEKGMKRAEDGVEDFKQEANSTAKEAAASFDGSAESIIDAFQEVTANAFEGFGPAGQLAGLGAAAGIGLAVAGFQKVQEAEEESRKRAAEWAEAYIEAGDRILTSTQIVEKGRKILADQQDELKKNAQDWGVSESIAMLAMSGDTNALIEVRESLARKEERVQEAVGKTGGNLRVLNKDMRDMRQDVIDGTDSLDKLTGEMDTGARLADTYSESLRLLAEHTQGATKKVDEFGDTVVTLPDGKEIYIDAQTGKATDNVNAIERKIYGIPDGHAKVNLDVSDALRKLNRFITDSNGRSFTLRGRVKVDSGFGNGVD